MLFPPTHITLRKYECISTTKMCLDTSILTQRVLWIGGSISGQHHITTYIGPATHAHSQQANTRGIEATGALFTVHTGRTPGLAQCFQQRLETDQAHEHSRVSGVQRRHGHNNKQKPCSPRGRKTLNPIQYHPLHARHGSKHLPDFR
jgi:hypothetical protein